MTYIFRCRNCLARVEGHLPNPEDHAHVVCALCGSDRGWTRDYRAEAASVAVSALKRDRERGTDGESGRKALRDLFLPTMDDFRSPSDPTGEKGMREWNDRHGPRETNKKPLYPDVPKRSFAISK